MVACLLTLNVLLRWVRREHVERWLWFLSLVALTGLALWLRREGGTTSAPNGDESLYFALSRDLGVARPPAFAQHIAARPLFYVLWHLPAQLGLETVQLLHETLSACVPLATVAVARALGHGRIAALLGGLVVALHAPSIQFSWTFYPDTTATLLATLGAAGTSAGAGRCAGPPLRRVATKELVAVVPLGFAARDLPPAAGDPRLLGGDRGRVTVAASPGGEERVPDVQGWGGGPPEPHFLLAMGCSLAFLPIGVLLVVGGRWREIILALAYPGFFVLWVMVRKRGVNDWYLPCVAPFLGIAISGAADVASRARPWFLRVVTVGAFAWFLVSARGARPARAQRSLRSPDAATRAVAEARAHHPQNPGSSTLLAYNVYPFDLAPEVHGIWTNGPEDGLAQARRFDVVILEEQTGNQALRDLLAPCGKKLAKVWVYVTASCAQ